MTTKQQRQELYQQWEAGEQRLSELEHHRHELEPPEYARQRAQLVTELETLEHRLSGLWRTARQPRA